LEIGYNVWTKPRDKTCHRTIAIALGVMGALKDPGPHIRKLHHAVAIALGTIGEPKDPDLRMTMNHHATAVFNMVVEVDDQDHRDGVMITHVWETRET
jgi:hypothetical protein